MAKVLIIEDDPSMQKIFASSFTHEGFEVTSAGDAGVGLIRLEEQAFDLIMLDLMMPGQSGLDFLKIYREKYTANPASIIVMSNLDNPAIIDKIKALGVAGYFVKSNQDPQVVVEHAKSVVAQRAPNTISDGAA